MGQIRGVIGGFNGPGFRSQGLGKVSGTRGFLSNNLPLRQASGEFPYLYPQALFAKGEPGLWYDPSDFSTMYQDISGTIPVVAVGQPVGMWMDKSKGLVLGTELALPLQTQNYVVSNNQDATHIVTWLDSGGYRYQSDTTTPAMSVTQVAGTMTIGNWYEVTVTIANYISGTIKTDSLGSAGQSAPFSGNGTFKWRGLANSQNINITRAGTNVDLCVVGLSIKQIPGNHAIQATTANRPILTQDANGAYSLAFNGTNSSLATAANVDFTSTSKITTFTGLYKPTDSGSPTVFELSAAADANPNSFFLRAPTGGVANYQFLMEGTATNNSATPSIAAPDSAVLTGQGDLTSGAVSLRRNGAVTIGPGNSVGTVFGNYPLYIGSRASSTLYFPGRLYSLIVRGAQSSAIEVSNTEAFINGKMGGVY